MTDDQRMEEDRPNSKEVGLWAFLGEWWSKFRSWRERYHLKPLISVLMYLVIPLVAIHLIMAQYPLLDKARFYRIISWIVPFGIGLFIITLIQERFRKGSGLRLALDGVFVLFAMFWLFGFLGGRTVIASSYGTWHFSVDVTPIVCIALFGTGMNFIRDLLEYMAHRQGIDLGIENTSIGTSAVEGDATKDEWVTICAIEEPEV